MTEYEWSHETPLTRPDGTMIERGDVFHPSDHEQRVWGDRMREQATCAATKANGRPCSRTVGGDAMFCWQHRDTDDGDGNTDEE